MYWRLENQITFPDLFPVRELDALFQDLSLELSEVGKEAGHKITICAGVNCSGDGRVLEPTALKGAS